MEQQYSHLHVKNAHHSGLIIGTLVGSLTITSLILFAAMVSNPSYILKPYNLLTSVTIKDEVRQPIESGVASKQINSQDKAGQLNSGGGASSIMPLGDR